jgi:hypothetical protein
MQIPGGDRLGLWPAKHLQGGRDNSKHSEDAKRASPGESTGLAGTGAGRIGRRRRVFRYKSLRFFANKHERTSSELCVRTSLL